MLLLSYSYAIILVYELNVFTWIVVCQLLHISSIKVWLCSALHLKINVLFILRIYLGRTQINTATFISPVKSLGIFCSLQPKGLDLRNLTKKFLINSWPEFVEILTVYVTF